MAKKYIVVRIEREGNVLVANSVAATHGFSKSEAQHIEKDAGGNCLMLAYSSAPEMKLLKEHVLNGTHEQCKEAWHALYGMEQESVPVVESYDEVACDTGLMVSPLGDDVMEEEEEEVEDVECDKDEFFEESDYDDREWEMLSAIATDIYNCGLDSVSETTLSMLLSHRYTNVESTEIGKWLSNLSALDAAALRDRSERERKERERDERNKRIAQEVVSKLHANMKEMLGDGYDESLVRTMEAAAIKKAIYDADNNIVKMTIPVMQSKVADKVVSKEVKATVAKKGDVVMLIDQAHYMKPNGAGKSELRDEQESGRIIESALKKWEHIQDNKVVVNVMKEMVADAIKCGRFALMNKGNAENINKRMLLHLLADALVWATSEEGIDFIYVYDKAANDRTRQGIAVNIIKDALNAYTYSDMDSAANGWTTLRGNGFMVCELLERAHKSGVSPRNAQSLMKLYVGLYTILGRALDAGHKAKRAVSGK